MKQFFGYYILTGILGYPISRIIKDKFKEDAKFREDILSLQKDLGISGTEMNKWVLIGLGEFTQIYRTLMVMWGVKLLRGSK